MWKMMQKDLYGTSLVCELQFPKEVHAHFV